MKLAIVVALVLALLLFIAVSHEAVDEPERVVTTSTTTTSTEPPPTTTSTTATTAPPTTVARVARTAPTAPSKRLTLSSTMYCEHGVMASGKYTHDGAVSSKVLPRGSRWRVLSGALAGRVFTVEDTGSLAIFDMWVPSCATAIQYGRRPISIEAA